MRVLLCTYSRVRSVITSGVQRAAVARGPFFPLSEISHRNQSPKINFLSFFLSFHSPGVSCCKPVFLYLKLSYYYIRYPRILVFRRPNGRVLDARRLRAANAFWPLSVKLYERMCAFVCHPEHSWTWGKFNKCIEFSFFVQPWSLHC